MPYRDWLQATDPEDPVWRNMRLGPALTRVAVPVLLQTGWQDRFPAQMLEQYERLQRRGVAVGLTIGPWTHVQTATKGAGTVMTEALDWFAEHLSATGDRRRPSPVRIFVTGAEEWRHLATWPPPTEERVLYLQPRRWAQRDRAAATQQPNGVHLRPRGSHSGCRRPRDQPDDRGAPRQPQAGGAIGRSHLHQHTAGRAYGGCRQPPRRVGVRDRQSTRRLLRQTVRGQAGRSIHQRERWVHETGNRSTERDDPAPARRNRSPLQTGSPDPATGLWWSASEVCAEPWYERRPIDRHSIWRLRVT